MGFSHFVAHRFLTRPVYAATDVSGTRLKQPSWEIV